MAEYETLLYEEDDGSRSSRSTGPRSTTPSTSRCRRSCTRCGGRCARTTTSARWSHGRRREGVLHRHRPGGDDRRSTSTTRRRGVGRRAGSSTPFMFNDPGENINPKQNDLWKPVIAAVNGMACGGALYMLGEADIIIAAEHATFFDPHVTYGMVAGFETGAPAAEAAARRDAAGRAPRRPRADVRGTGARGRPGVRGGAGRPS